MHNTYTYYAYKTFTSGGPEPVDRIHGACRRTECHARRRAVVAQPAGSEPGVATVAGHVPRCPPDQDLLRVSADSQGRPPSARTRVNAAAIGPLAQREGLRSGCGRDLL